MSSSSASISLELIDQLFLQFAVFYGHVWRSQFKGDTFIHFAKKEWHRGLNIFDGAIINQVIDYCRDSLEFPPALAVFIGLCREIVDKQNAPVIAAERAMHQEYSHLTAEIKCLKLILPAAPDDKTRQSLEQQLLVFQGKLQQVASKLLTKPDFFRNQY